MLFLWIAVATGLVFAVLVPLVLRIQSFPATYLASVGQLGELERRIDLFNQTKSEFESIMERAPDIRERFLRQDDAIRLIEWLEAQSRSEGLFRDLRLVREPDYAAGGASAAVFEFQATLVGSFEGIMRFLAIVEHGPYAVDVLQIQMEPAKAAQTYTIPGAKEPFKPRAGDIAASLVLRIHAAR